MYDSLHRRNVQWSFIATRIKQRPDILPFNYTSSITLKVDGEKFVCGNEQEFRDHMEYILKKYGEDVNIAQYYYLNYPKLLDEVEDVYRTLCGIPHSSTSSKVGKMMKGGR